MSAVRRVIMELSEQRIHQKVFSFEKSIAYSGKTYWPASRGSAGHRFPRMHLTLDQLILRLEDPGTPVVWVDPILSEELFAPLPAALERHGFSVWDLDAESPVTHLKALVERMRALPGADAEPRMSAPGLTECLMRLPDTGRLGSVVIFRDPDPLRQSDEGAFEDFMEALEVVHETRYEIRGRMFKLVVKG